MLPWVPNQWGQHSYCVLPLLASCTLDSASQPALERGSLCCFTAKSTNAPQPMPCPRHWPTAVCGLLLLLLVGKLGGMPFAGLLMGGGFAGPATCCCTGEGGGAWPAAVLAAAPSAPDQDWLSVAAPAVAGGGWSGLGLGLEQLVPVHRRGQGTAVVGQAEPRQPTAWRSCRPWC